MKTTEIANQWRAQQSTEIASAGLVLIWRGEVYGWKNQLRDAQAEQPGAIAVDVAGHQFRAAGGDDYNGALGWIAV